jgi:hypothetical protein
MKSLKELHDEEQMEAVNERFLRRLRELEAAIEAECHRQERIVKLLEALPLLPAVVFAIMLITKLIMWASR